MQLRNDDILVDVVDDGEQRNCVDFTRYPKSYVAVLEVRNSMLLR
jgi:hypothetical protein